MEIKFSRIKALIYLTNLRFLEKHVSFIAKKRKYKSRF